MRRRSRPFRMTGLPAVRRQFPWVASAPHEGWLAVTTLAPATSSRRCARIPRQNRTSSTDPALSPATHDGIRKESRLTPGGRGPDSAREPRAIHPFRRTLPARSGARLREDCVAIESWPSREGNTAAQGGTPAVALESVVKRFGDVVAVDGIDLAIADGEFFSMLGPSGSG